MPARLCTTGRSRLSRDVLKTLNWTRIRLENIRISDQRLRLILAHFPPRTFNIAKAERINTADNVNNCRCPLVNLPDDWDSYLNSLSSNTRQKIRRFLRMVESDPKYRIAHARPDTIERDVDLLLELWSSRWGSRKGDRLNAMVRSSRSILLSCFESGSVLLPVLWHDDTPLGALAIFVDRQKASFLFFIGGRDDSVHSPPPGLVLHAYSIRHAIAHGFRTYDFLRGNEAYKYSFGAREHRIHCLAVGTKTGRNLGEKLDRRSLPAVLRYATELHNRGNLAEAERGYRQILAIAAFSPSGTLGSRSAADRRPRRAGKHVRGAWLRAAFVGPDPTKGLQAGLTARVQRLSKKAAPPLGAGPSENVCRGTISRRRHRTTCPIGLAIRLMAQDQWPMPGDVPVARSEAAPILLGFLDHCTVKLCCVRSTTQALNRAWIPQFSCNACKRLKLVAFRRGGKKKQEHDIDRLAVDCLKIDRVLETHKHPEWSRHFRHACMGHGDAAPRPCGPQFLTLEQFGCNAIGCRIERRCRPPG